jgi:hypothetical protein
VTAVAGKFFGMELHWQLQTTEEFKITAGNRFKLMMKDRTARAPGGALFIFNFEPEAVISIRPSIHPLRLHPATPFLHLPP